MTLRQATEAVTSANYRSPKTILGFFAVVLSVLASATVVVVGILAGEPKLHRLIVPVLTFLGVVIVSSLASVLLTAWKDPTILLLGQVTGEIYIANRKLSLGDSGAGEFVQSFAIPRRLHTSASARKPAAKTSEVEP
ncbi:MAG TPA: hypothetical protein VEK57_29685 [Thermoanaerobaculia bacterium]|nr:hypothetical protein [Thermoanaerobaculia bacterium]